jgi:hypothetical protein
MVAIVTSSSIDYKQKTGLDSGNTSSTFAYHSDPDLLIREYFRSSSTQRAASRKTIIKHIKSFPSVLEILRWGSTSKIHDGYDGAVNLLAETNDIELLKTISQIAENIYVPMLQNSSSRNFAENSLEIIIKAIACAYQLDVNQRFRLLNLIPKTDRRAVKAAIIDALTLIADEIDANRIKTAIEAFNSDRDPYIRNYAQEALQDIS